MESGVWWTLLSLGEYCFYPYKIIWRSYGTGDFKPILVTSYENREWQGNQALHSFIPIKTEKEAKEVLKKLQKPMYENFLKSNALIGSKSWAQPGKIKGFCDFID